MAERRLVAGLRRRQRREPLRADVRVDALVAEVRAAEPSRPSGHRGRDRLALTDAQLRAVVDDLVASGALVRERHRVRLAAGGPALDQVMRERIDLLLDALRAGAFIPPPAEIVAKGLGIPLALLDQLRLSGELVRIGPRIEYPRESWSEITSRLDRLAVATRLSVRAVRDDLGITRRHAEAILRSRRAE